MNPTDDVIYALIHELQSLRETVRSLQLELHKIHAEISIQNEVNPNVARLRRQRQEEMIEKEEGEHGKNYTNESL